MKYWKHKIKKPNLFYRGSYSYHRGERVFELKRLFGNKRTITFESWQMAKKLGWVLK